MKKRWTRFAWLMMIGLLWSSAVWADQCAVDLDTDASWFNLIMTADKVEVVSFCEPCRDKKPKRLNVLDL